MNDFKNPWTKLSERNIYDNPWINVKEHKVLNPNGNEGIYGKVSFKNRAIGVIPVDKNGNTWLVGQYRYTIDQYSWEIPEGGGAKSETPEEAGLRELREETGLIAGKMREILTMHLSNCVSDEIGHVFLAEELTMGEQQLDDTEKLQIMKLPLAKAIDMVMSGEITDSLSVAGLLKLERLDIIQRKVEILYQDEYCVIVNKPTELLVHRTEMSKDKEFLLQIVRDQVECKVHPIHRLDRPTSGVILFSLDQTYISTFSKLFSGRNIQKTYIALVRGFTDDEGVIDSPLRVNATSKQEALTEYRTLARVELQIPIPPYETSRYSLVEINLKTGRTHQIRRHFAHIRHPLVGDTKYGDGKHNKMFRAKFNSSRLMLMATKMQFTHPYTNKDIMVEAALDDDIKLLLSQLSVNVEGLTD